MRGHVYRGPLRRGFNGVSRFLVDFVSTLLVLGSQVTDGGACGFRRLNFVSIGHLGAIRRPYSARVGPIDTRVIGAASHQGISMTDEMRFQGPLQRRRVLSGLLTLSDAGGPRRPQRSPSFRNSPIIACFSSRRVRDGAGQLASRRDWLGVLEGRERTQICCH